MALHREAAVLEQATALMLCMRQCLCISFLSLSSCALLESCASSEEAQLSSALSADGHFWSQRGGNGLSRSSTRAVAPTNLSAGPAWTWQNTDGSQVRCSPLIDSARNIYISAGLHLFKYTKDGQLLWSWDSHRQNDGRTNTCPALYKAFVV
eukprot:2633256-Amphidinium_carterae.1